MDCAANWSKTTEESKELVWRSPGSSDAANLIVSISPMDESFPTDISIQAFYDGAKTRAKNGEVDELKWVEIDGLKVFSSVNQIRRSRTVFDGYNGSLIGNMPGRYRWLI